MELEDIGLLEQFGKPSDSGSKEAFLEKLKHLTYPALQLIHYLTILIVRGGDALVSGTSLPENSKNVSHNSSFNTESGTIIFQPAGNRLNASSILRAV